VANKDLDGFVYGARAIGAEADLFVRDKNGEIVLENGKPKVDVRKAHYALEKGYIDADKFGPRIWRSTPRRIKAA
jgi:hypothetical protein